MSVISYAQNFEDVMLARALDDIDEGFYVDVGAQDPAIDSVTKLFYERGWRGINVEPVERWYERLQADRPADVNLRCAVGDHMGTLELHAIADSGLSTSSEEFAREHVLAGRSSVIEVVPLATLDSILEARVPNEIHFLKIDVEGMEKEVIAGLSLARYRPWILLIEATLPNQPVDVSGVWEPMVLSAGYTLVYRDGLNRFYLANEQMARAPAFALPPNVFDDFVTYREVAANRFAESLELRLQNYHDRVQTLQQDLVAVADTAEARQQRLDEIARALADREEMLQERATLVERYRLDLLTVSQTAEKRQQRLDELQCAIEEREEMLQERATLAERYRLDLLTVSQTAEKRQQRLDELQCAIEEREEVLQERTLVAERYRLDLLVVSETAEKRYQRLLELERQLAKRDVDLGAVAAAAENRRVRMIELEQALIGVRHALQMTTARRDALQAEFDRVQSSRSWKFTSPLRAGNRIVRGWAGRVLRVAAGIPVIRMVGARLPAGRFRQRMLSLAGFRADEPVTDRAPPSSAAPPELPPHIPSMSRPAMRIHRMLSAAARKDERDT